MGRISAVFAVSGAMLSALAVPAAAQEHRWETTGNAKFEFTMCFPADLMTPQPESDDGDGRILLAKDGTELRVWGSYNTQDLTPAQALANQTKYIEKDGGKVSYKVARADWLVLSGTMGDRIFYQRASYDKVRFASFRLTYPKAQAAKWKPIAEHLSTCLDGHPQ